MLILSITFLFSCDLEETIEEEQQQITPIDKFVDPEALMTKSDNLKNKRDDIFLELRELKKKFNFVKNDFDQPSYYHKNLSGNEYYLAYHALIAGVDSSGHFFLVSNYRGGDLDLRHTKIEIEIGTDKFILESDTLLPEMKPNDWHLSACTQEQGIYSQADAFDLGKRISENTGSKITMTFIGKVKHSITVLKKEKDRVRDCYLIAYKMKQIKAIKAEIDSIREELLNNKKRIDRLNKNS